MPERMTSRYDEFTMLSRKSFHLSFSPGLPHSITSVIPQDAESTGAHCSWGAREGSSNLPATVHGSISVGAGSAVCDLASKYKLWNKTKCIFLFEVGIDPGWNTSLI